MKNIGLLALLFLLILGCTNKNSIEGLWVIDMVVVGQEEITPNARWTRLNDDGTQQSGNGWFQHSVGTWTLDKNSRELSIRTINGTKDPFGPFEVNFDSDTMTWTRMEEGNEVTVKLKRAKELPQTYGDRVLGLWKLEESNGEGPYLSDEAAPQAMLFLRWDRRFELGTPDGTIYGVYNVHGHRPEIELIPYGDKLDRNFWSFECTHSQLSIQLLNSEEKVTRKFIRTNQFPE